MMRQRPFSNHEVEAVFAVYPPRMREKLLRIRQLIFETAANTERVGKLTETLKWGQPSYLTNQTKSGSTVRIGVHNEESGQYGVYFNCKSDLVSKFKGLLPDTFIYDGNRAILFNEDDNVPEEELCTCIATALTHHLKKKRG